MKRIIEKLATWILTIAFGEIPIWTFGLECNICKTTFKGPTEHLKHVNEHDTMILHKNQIPKLG